MNKQLRARFSHGVLEPLEPLDLEEGKEVMVSIEEAPALNPGALSMLQMFEGIRGSAPGVTWDDMPADGAKNVDHYLYGWPKDSES